MTPRLRDLQSQFKTAILDGDLEAVARFVRPDRLTAIDRLRIYRNHTHSSLAAALADNFPVICRLVGQDFFDATAKRFIANHPPGEPCLSAYGATFPDFLATFEPARALAYLPDVARLEWLRIEVTHAPDARALDLETLASLPEEAQRCLPLRLVPRVQLFFSPYPIDRIWLANQEADVPAIDLNEGGCLLLIAYGDHGCRLLRLSPGAHMFLDAAANGASLQDAAEQALATESGFDLVGALTIHRTTGALADTIETYHRSIAGHENGIRTRADFHLP